MVANLNNTSRLKKVLSLRNVELSKIDIHVKGSFWRESNVGAWAFTVQTLRGDRTPGFGLVTEGRISNAIMECTAIVKALEHALQKYKDSHIRLFTSMESIAGQINGLYSCKSEDLKDLIHQARTLKSETGAVVEYSKNADAKNVSILTKIAVSRRSVARTTNE